MKDITYDCTDRISRDEISKYLKGGYGHSYVKLNKKDLEHLKSGGVIAFCDGEYTHSIELEQK